jgi:hypothetical protein
LGASDKTKGRFAVILIKSGIFFSSSVRSDNEYSLLI